jgi:hypothetical protein
VGAELAALAGSVYVDRCACLLGGGLLLVTELPWLPARGAGDDPLSQVVNAAINFKPLFSVMKVRRQAAWHWLFLAKKLATR